MWDSSGDRGAAVLDTLMRTPPHETPEPVPGGQWADWLPHGAILAAGVAVTAASA
eukprot:gene19811-6953_t